eukprot:gene15842-biopygen17215
MVIWRAGRGPPPLWADRDLGLEQVRFTGRGGIQAQGETAADADRARGRTIGFKGTGAGRTRAGPFLPSGSPADGGTYSARAEVKNVRTTATGSGF